MSGLPGAWPGLNGAAIPGSVTCGTGAARWAGRPPRLVRPSPGGEFVYLAACSCSPFRWGPAISHGAAATRWLLRWRYLGPVSVIWRGTTCGTIHRRSTAAAQLRAGDRGSRWGATGCTERPSSALNCTRRPATAPTPACGFSSPQVRVGAASCFPRSALRFCASVDSALCRLAGECAQVKAVRSSWLRGPCIWEQVGCRLAKWSTRPKCSPTQGRDEDSDLRWGRRAARCDHPVEVEVVRRCCVRDGWRRPASRSMWSVAGELFGSAAVPSFETPIPRAMS